MARILIVDDDQLLCRSLGTVLEEMGHTVQAEFRLEDALAAAQSTAFAAVILDVWLPDGNGLEALSRFRVGRVPPEVIILTGAGDPDGAELA
ncbi:MAG: response regulator, partial [Desulfohalobium sp.]